MIRSLLASVAAAAALMLPAGPAHAIFYSGSYTVTANDDPGVGLAVETINNFGSPVDAQTNSFASMFVPVPGVHFVDLFDIFALESPPYGGDDFVPQPITVAFDFTSPDLRSGIVSGTTVGTINDEGELHWSGPIVIFFMNHRLEITLFDATFSDSFNGVVVAQFEAIPEPGMLALLGVGLIGVFVFRRRAAA